MLLGLIGIILPVIPGLILIWLGAFGFALAEKFASIDPLAFIFLSVLTIIGVTAEIWMSQLGAKWGGATFKSQLIGLAGGVVGALLVPVLAGLLETLLGPVFGPILAGLLAIFGAAVGSVIGVLGAEYYRLKDRKKAVKAGCGWFMGWLASMIFQFAVGAVIIIIFVWQAFRG